MSDPLWASVDQYLSDLYLPKDEALEAALQSSQAANLPAIQVSPHLGSFLYVLAQMNRARRILEIGTLGGYSTIWLGRAILAQGGAADGKLISLEYEKRHADVARGNIARAGLASVVEVRVGAALDTLPMLAIEKHFSPFDFIFIDADKENYPAYFEWSLRLAHPGTAIVIDNVVRKGGIADAHSHDSAIVATQKLHKLIAATPNIEKVTLQTVGQKGYDGFTLVLVK